MRLMGTLKVRYISVFLPFFLERQDNIYGILFAYLINELTLLHSEWPKLHRVLAVLSAIGEGKNLLLSYSISFHIVFLSFNPAALRTFGCSD